MTNSSGFRSVAEGRSGGRKSTGLGKSEIVTRGTRGGVGIRELVRRTRPRQGRPFSRKGARRRPLDSGRGAGSASGGEFSWVSSTRHSWRTRARARSVAWVQPCPRLMLRPGKRRAEVGSSVSSATTSSSAPDPNDLRRRSLAAHGGCARPSRPTCSTSGTGHMAPFPVTSRLSRGATTPGAVPPSRRVCTTPPGARGGSVLVPRRQRQRASAQLPQPRAFLAFTRTRTPWSRATSCTVALRARGPRVWTVPAARTR